MITLTQNRVTTGKLLTLAVLLAALAASLMLAARPAHASTPFTVINTNDSGAGSLRQAIVDANATAGADVIEFNIPGTDVHTIAPDSQLPTITDPVTIDGYSQPGAQPNTKAVGSDAILKIELSGANEPSGTGLYIKGPNSTVKGLAINRWTFGIWILGSEATGNRIAGNYIGTDDTGTQDLGNGYYGVFISNASGNTIGGAEAAARNVISGNEQHGVSMEGQATVDNRIVGNYIGTDASGTRDLGNQFFGVQAYLASNNTLGGTTAAERNVISGNGASGVVVAADSNKVSGNHIGTNATGTRDLGNGEDGVQISGSNNTLGGTTAAARNVVSGNAGSGVSIAGADATGNRVLGNSTFSNGGLGIDLGDDGPTANDSGDTDKGPNNLQNKPVLTSSKKSATGTTTIKGTLGTTPNSTFRVEFFSNPKDTEEGKTLLGSKAVSTDGSGKASFTFSTKKQIGLGQNITATATGPGGNTSEFSAPKKVVAS